MTTKRWIVEALDRLCVRTHWLTGHNIGCQLATWSWKLDEHWGTGQWKSGVPDAD